MADENTQTVTNTGVADNSAQPVQSDAAMPDWLKNAKALADHEEKSAELAPLIANGASTEAAAQPTEPTVVTPADLASDVSTLPASTKNDALPLEEKKNPLQVFDAPLPAWLKNAGATAGVAINKFADSLASAQDAGLRKNADGTTELLVSSNAQSTPEEQMSAEKVEAAEQGPVLVEAPAAESFELPQVAESAAPVVTAEVNQPVAETVTAVESAPVVETVKAEVSKQPAKIDKKKQAQEKAKAELEEKKKTIDAEKIFQEGLASVRDLISPSSIEIKYDSLRVEGMYAQSFFVYAYPRYLDTNWLSPIVNFDVTMDMSQFIYPIDSGAIMRILKKKVAQMQASVRMNAEKGMVSDPALETALEDADELRTQIQRGQEKLFQFALYFTIYSEDEKKLQKTAKQLESMLGAKLILTKKAELQTEYGFNSTLPICLDELGVMRNMNTSPLSTTFPFSSSDLTSNDGILYGLNRHNDSLIIFDRFSLENANSVVFAKSGAGKSYAVKLEILRYMMMGTDVIVIDPEAEYVDLTQTVGGSYLKVSLTSDRRINPFDLPEPLADEELQPGDLLRSSIINLHGLMKIMLGGVTPEEEGILDKALNDVYAVKGITMDMVDPSKVAPPTMEDLYDILNTMEGGQSMAQRLQKYTSGTYSGIFNKPTNVDLSSGLMVFGIRDLEDALRPIAMYIILNYIWNKVRSKLKKRLMVIDEAWTMMQHEDSARFLFGLVKRARKYYLGITTITQDVEDFVKSAYGKPVVTNSSMQLLLKQAPSAVDYLTKIFNLTEGEKYMLLNSGVGQGLFFAGQKHVAIQIIASYTEDKIVTTNPEQILKSRGTDEQVYE